MSGVSARHSTAEDDWAALMARAQTGDQRAYTALMHSLMPYLRHLVRRSLRDARDVEEVVQDTLLTIHKIRHTYDTARPFAPWVAVIAQRRAADRVRSNILHARRKLALAEELLTQPVDEADPIDPDRYEGLRAAIDALPSCQRQAIQMLKLRQLSLKEAAALSGQSITALKVATHRAVRRLQATLCRPDHRVPDAA